MSRAGGHVRADDGSSGVERGWRREILALLPERGSYGWGTGGPLHRVAVPVTSG